MHYNRLALKAYLKPHRFPVKPEALLVQEFGEDGDEGEEVDLPSWICMICICWQARHDHLPSVCRIILIIQRGGI